MSSAADAPDLSGLVEALAKRGVWIGARRILPGDESAFPPGTSKAGPALERARASGAARIAARAGIVAMGGPADAALPRGPNRAPVWPDGFLGSLAHDEAFAIAAVARTGELQGVGIDMEPAEALPRDVAEHALSDEERAGIAGEGVQERLAFAAKEAVYKAVNPFDGSPLEYADIAVDLTAARARLRDGRSLDLFASARGRCVVVACLDRPATKP